MKKNMAVRKFKWLAVVLSLSTSLNLWAQAIPYETELDSITESKPEEPSSPPPPVVPQVQRPLAVPAESRPSKTPQGELAGLGRLTSFSDIAVINRRFLPKTKRFEISPNFGLILNDPFFNSFAIFGRVGYYFTEQWGVEGLGIFLSTANKSVTDSLVTQRRVSTESLATPTGYYGAAIKWAPLYGKMSLLNKTILPFDTYFVLGGGVTSTNQSTNPVTLHLGTGQIYAINKWFATRWDFSFFTYRSETTVATRSGGTFNNLYISIGASFFFPSAEYR